MGYVTREMIDRAKEMDLLTYLQTYEPQELMHFGGSTYCTREHDSLKISNGKWCWFSRGIGGRTALDYLIKVKEIPFTEAVERIVGRAAGQPPISCTRQQPEQTKTLLLPQVSRCAAHAVEYLHSRGIDYELIDFCIRTGRLYESYPHHNAVFVGKDKDGQPRYACLRGIGTDFKGEATGSDTVDAESREEAEAAVRCQYKNGEYALVSADSDGVSFSAQYPEQQVELSYPRSLRGWADRQFLLRHLLLRRGQRHGADYAAGGAGDQHRLSVTD